MRTAAFAYPSGRTPPMQTPMPTPMPTPPLAEAATQPLRLAAARHVCIPPRAMRHDHAQWPATHADLAVLENLAVASSSLLQPRRPAPHQRPVRAATWQHSSERCGGDGIERVNVGRPFRSYRVSGPAKKSVLCNAFTVKRHRRSRTGKKTPGGAGTHTGPFYRYCTFKKMSR